MFSQQLAEMRARAMPAATKGNLLRSARSCTRLESPRKAAESSKRRKGGEKTDVDPAGYERSLLPAALANGPSERLRHWMRWRALHPTLDRLGGIDFQLLPYVFARVSPYVEDDPYAMVFRGVIRRLWVSNQLLLAQACALQKELAEGGVPSVLFKGAALLLGVYRRAGDRAGDDIQVLIPARHRTKAISLLRKRRPSVVWSGHAIRFEGNDLIPADLHWVPSQWSLADAARRREDSARIERVVKARRTIETTGGRAGVPRVNDLALLNLTNLFAHSARVESDDGLWLLDLARLAATPGFEEKRLVQDIVDTDAVAIFQHHFRPFREVIPDPLRSLIEAVLDAPLDPVAHAVAAALAQTARRASAKRLEDPFRSQWYALRGIDDGRARLAERARYIAFCMRDTVGTVALSRRPHRQIGNLLRHSAAKTWEALTAQPKT